MQLGRSDRPCRRSLGKGFAIAVIACLLSASALGQSYSGMLTWHNDLARSGQNLQETTLTTTNVTSATFGKVFSFPVDGQIFTEPLYVYNVVIANKGTFNVVYVATENDSVYAFDASGGEKTALWQDSFIDAKKGITPIPCADTKASPCPFKPVIGITGTPVIDPSSGTLYVVAATKENGTYHSRLHALDITNGSEKFGGPVEITASVKGHGAGSKNGMVQFDALHESQRPALLLLNGQVYIGWASFGDVAPFHGWIISYAAATLTQSAVFNSTPNGSDGGFWQSAGGFSADASGNIYAISGNGTFDVNSGGSDYGDSFLKLSPTLTVLDYFTPNDQLKLSKNDLDLGSGAGMLLPLLTGIPSEILSAGKQGLMYLANTLDMGKFDPKKNHVLEIVHGAAGGYWGSPAYWNGNIYYSGRSDYLRQYSWSNGLLSESSIFNGPTEFESGSTPAISANGSTNGILWAVEKLHPTKGLPVTFLHAYDATNVSRELYNTGQAGNRDELGLAVSFAVPTVMNGRVYIGADKELDVLGLLP